MFWGCMLWEGPGFAARIDGNVDANLYTQILEGDFQSSLQFYHKNPQGIIFQQDNDPKYTSKKAKKWFQTHGFNVMSWPAQSPDLNPIEHLWDHLLWRLGLRVSYGCHEISKSTSLDCNKIRSDGVVRRTVGIAGWFPHYSYTVGPYGKVLW